MENQNENFLLSNYYTLRQTSTDDCDDCTVIQQCDGCIEVKTCEYCDDDVDPCGDECGHCYPECPDEPPSCEEYCDGCQGACEENAQHIGEFYFYSEKLSSEEWNRFVSHIKEGYSLSGYNTSYVDDAEVKSGQTIHAWQYNLLFEKMNNIMDQQGVSYYFDGTNLKSPGDKITSQDFDVLENYANNQYRVYYCESCDSEYPA